MNHNTPVSPRPLSHLTDAQRRVLSAVQLRAHGVSAAQMSGQCRPGGPWQQLLPGVFVLHPGPPTSEEQLHAALLYAGRPTASVGGPVVPAQVRAEGEAGSYGDVMLTGLAALALYRFSCAPSLLSLDRIDVLVPRTRRLRSTGCARLVRVHSMPQAQEIVGLPVAPVARALADAVAQLTDADVVRRLLTEAVRGGHCEPAAVVRELTLARLLSRPHVVDAVDSLLAEGRAIAEDRLYRMVRDHGLPDPLWNVDLRLPGGPHLGGVDIYWPDHAVAVELDTRAPRQDEDAKGSSLLERSRERGEWPEYARKREHLERLGITVVHITPKKLREALDQQATVVRTALMASSDREPPACVVVLPR
ncbi:hypothetical protein [Streptomyces chryseus]|uniref:Transcriptional regulator, AbiEi antitoxin, Type IV TA system n=1 Tax=Streptomyces chryseus TaxID=68186 RepID=A0ABQ3DHR3_9ACTN|nr:hypothetical protein [Streptomyces chryseus]GGX00309.1 hypothetical protein GCM10010353_14700 [Streptomyces chryseus]GHA88093.1 hypothetical protein GCM10010346_08670 [Streptomyces chryseus]